MWNHSSICAKLYCIFDLPFSPRCVCQGNLDDMLCDRWELLSSFFFFFFSWLGKAGDWGMEDKESVTSALDNNFSLEQSTGPGGSRWWITQVHPFNALSCKTRWLYTKCNLARSLVWAHARTQYLGKQALAWVQTMPGTPLAAKQGSFLAWQCLLIY